VLDADLVAAAQVDRRAFEGIWERYFNDIYRYCLSSRLPVEDAEDIAGDVFEHALKAIDSLDPAGGGVRAWLYTIARHQIASHHRRARLRRFLPFSDSAAGQTGGASTEEIVLLADALDRQFRLLDGLPATEQEVLRLRWVGLTHLEIATVLRKRPEAIRAASSRAERRLGQFRAEEERHGR
jgi:RNA polymerase sigma-70 factor (ECF subfamily)